MCAFNTVKYHKHTKTKYPDVKGAMLLYICQHIKNKTCFWCNNNVYSMDNCNKVYHTHIFTPYRNRCLMSDNRIKYKFYIDQFYLHHWWLPCHWIHFNRWHKEENNIKLLLISVKFDFVIVTLSKDHVWVRMLQCQVVQV